MKEATSKLLLAGVLSLASSMPSWAENIELIVTTYGGTFEEGWRKSVIEPFERENPNIKVKVSQGLAFQNLALLRAQKDNVDVDVVMMEKVAAIEAAAEGLTESLSEKDLPNLSFVYPSLRAPDDQFAVFGYFACVLAYNTSLVKEKPESWLDIFVKSGTEHVAVNNLDTVTGLLFMMNMQHTLKGDPATLDLAFAEVKEKSGQILTYPTQHAQLAQLLAQGDVAIAPWTHDRAISAKLQGAPIDLVLPSEGSVLTEGSLVIAKGSKKLEAAKKYVNFALSVAAQSATAEYSNVFPSNSSVELKGELAALLPSGGDPFESAALRTVDWATVNKSRADWLNFWNRDIVSR